MAISPQRLTVYLYSAISAHRAVIFAIAQLSCRFYEWQIVAHHGSSASSYNRLWRQLFRDRKTIRIVYQRMHSYTLWLVTARQLCRASDCLSVCLSRCGLKKTYRRWCGFHPTVVQTPNTKFSTMCRKSKGISSSKTNLLKDVNVKSYAIYRIVSFPLIKNDS